VVQDIFPTETVAFADVVLPGVSFAEKEGTFSNTERRVQKVNKAVEPLGNAWPDWKIVAELGARMTKGREHRPPPSSPAGITTRRRRSWQKSQPWRPATAA